MAYTFDAETRKIVLPAGDTMEFRIAVNSTVYHAVIFAIYDRREEIDLLRIPAEIVDGAAKVRLTNKHTRDLEPGRYKWNLRLVEDPEYDEDGNIIADDPGDDVLTVFGPDRSAIPDFQIVKNGGYV